MDDEISIIKGNSPVKKRLIKPWGTHLQNRLERPGKTNSEIKPETPNDSQEPPNLDKVFDQSISSIKENRSKIELVIGIILVLIVSFYFSLILVSLIERIESKTQEIEVKKTILAKKEVQLFETETETETQTETQTKKVIESLPYQIAKDIDKKIANIKQKRDIYISNSLSEYDLSLEYVDALLHCDYLEFSGSALSFKSSYRINFSCFNDGDTKYFVNEKQYINSRNNLKISGYVYNGNIVLSHSDNVLFAEKMGYENLINYESRNDIQKDYISWLSKSLVAWDYISD